MQRNIKIPVWAGLFFLMLLVNGCAYFNTFFNARKSFNQGVKARNERVKQVAKEERKQGNVVTFQENFPGHEPDKSIANAGKDKMSVAVDKTNKVLSLHADSKWVDDALLLQGKALYFRAEGNDLFQGSEKIKELLNRFPDSELVQEAWLWLGRISLKRNRSAEAVGFLEEAAQIKKDPDLAAGALIELARIAFAGGTPTSPVIFLGDALTRAKDDRLKFEAQFTLAMYYFRQDDFESAALNFRKAKQFADTRHEEFDIDYMIGLANKEAGALEDAAKVFKKLRTNRKNEDFYPKLELEIADCYRLQGDLVSAVRDLEYVIETYPKTRHSADAYYFLGLIHETPGDTAFQKTDRARTFYNMVKLEFSGSVYGKVAENRVTKINQKEFLTLRPMLIRQKIDTALLVVDSLQALVDAGLLNPDGSVPIDSSTLNEVPSLPDSLSLSEADSVAADSLEEMPDEVVVEEAGEVDEVLFPKGKGAEGGKTGVAAGEDGKLPGPTPVRNEKLEAARQAVRKDIARVRGSRSLEGLAVDLNAWQHELQESYLELGEYYHNEAAEIDSAVKYYGLAADRFGETSREPEALFFAGFTAEKIGDSSYVGYYQTLTERYPDSEYSDAARRLLGLEIVRESDTLQQQIAKAEDFLFGQNDYWSALGVYKEIASSDSANDYVATAIYMSGLIYETRTDSGSKAFDYYDRLVTTYPKSALAAKVQKKVDEFRKLHPVADPVIEEPADTTGAGAFADSSQFDVPADSVLDESAVDSSGQSADTVAAGIDKPAPRKKKKKQWTEVYVEPKVIGGADSVLSFFVYPKKARKKEIEGTFSIQVTVDQDGNPVKVEVLSGPEQEAMRAAVEAAVLKSAWEPALQMGEPVYSVTIMELTIRYKDFKE